MSLPQKNRLPLRTQRERIDKEGQSIYSSYFTLVRVASPSETNIPRFAVLISRKVSPKAVDRNHLKRQILSIIHQHTQKISPADYLIIPKKSALNVPFELIETDLRKLLLRP